MPHSEERSILSRPGTLGNSTEVHPCQRRAGLLSPKAPTSGGPPAGLFRLWVPYPGLGCKGGAGGEAQGLCKRDQRERARRSRCVSPLPQTSTRGADGWYWSGRVVSLQRRTPSCRTPHCAVGAQVGRQTDVVEQLRLVFEACTLFSFGMLPYLLWTAQGDVQRMRQGRVAGRRGASVGRTRICCVSWAERSRVVQGHCLSYS